MLKSKKIIILYLISSVAVSIFSYIGLWNYHAAITETAVSLCGKTLQSSDTFIEKSNKIKDYLAFIRIPDEIKIILQEAIENGNPKTSEIADRMMYFSFSPKALRELCRDINALTEESVPTFSLNASETANEKAKTLIRELYGKRVPFREVAGNGTDYLTRYYCNNICIDACADGSIRYIADVKEETVEDPLRALLFPEEETVIESSEVILSFVFQKLRCKQVYAEVCVDSHTKRIFAAKILFNS